VPATTPRTRCAAAPTWHLDAHGTLAHTGLCLRALFTGEIVASACDVDDPVAVFLDDEAPVSGIVPAPQDNMDTAHLDCVIAAGGRPASRAVRPGRAPSGSCAPMTATRAHHDYHAHRTRRAHGEAAARSRADGGARSRPERRGLMCAPRTTGGALLQAVRIDNPTAPVAVEPRASRWRHRRRRRDPMRAARRQPLLCALAAGGYRANAVEHTRSGQPAPATATDRSLTITPGRHDLRAGDAGVVCGRRTDRDHQRPLDWPDRSAALWITDLEAITRRLVASRPGGPACSLASDASGHPPRHPLGLFAGRRGGQRRAGGALPTPRPPCSPTSMATAATTCAPRRAA